jgi:hypothetical protein
VPPLTGFTRCPMPARILAEERVQARFEIEPVRYLGMMEARHVGRGLQIGSEIEDVDQGLGVALRRPSPRTCADGRF